MNMILKSETNQIESSIVIHATLEKVWESISIAENFGKWFGANLQGKSFVQGGRVRGAMTGCGHDNVWFDVVIERVEPQTLLSFYWHPYPLDPSIDYSLENPTLVTFTLQDASDRGILLTVVESAFDLVPASRRLEAFKMNSSGWNYQLENIKRYVSD